VQLDICTSGPEALQILQQASLTKIRYDMVLMDAWMPGMTGYQTIDKLLQQALVRPKGVLVLTSSAVAGDAQRCRDLGIAGYLTKPLTLSEIQRALRDNLCLPETPASRAEMATSALQGLRVLLAEDNHINQRLVIKLLERFKIQLEIAANGIEAVAHFNRTPFDLILMDVMMPEMDGLQAASEIRKLELQAGMAETQHVPIIALTANAMQGDNENCLAAGMDGYVAKPIRSETLFAEMHRVLQSTSRTNRVFNKISTLTSTHLPVAVVIDQSISESTCRVDADAKTNLNKIQPESGAVMTNHFSDSNDPQTELLYDWNKALEMAEGDAALLQTVLEMFIAEVPVNMATMAAAVESSDAAGLAAVAHVLKGLLGMFCAEKAVEQALILEQAGYKGEINTVVFEAFTRTMNLLLIQLKQRLGC